MFQPPKAFGLFAATLTGVTLFFQGCAQEMANQPRVDTMEPSHFEFETVQNRTPVPGTVSRDRNLEQTPVQLGIENGAAVAKIPLPFTEALVTRGQDRFNVFCQHCHGMTGSADGMVVKRGFPAPPSYHTDRLMDFSDGQLFLTITNGVSRMPAFKNRIPVEDRWAIVAYIRALQLSQNVPVDSLPESERKNLK